MADLSTATLSRLAASLIDARHGLAVHSVPEIEAPLRGRMFELLRSCYSNVTEAQFNEDLSEKQWAIVGQDDATGGVWCFSTLKRISLDSSDGPAVFFYSGDTASRADTRGGATSAGTRLVVRKMFAEYALDPASDHYWFMISSTYKSYRLLAALFTDFAPGPGRRLTEAGKNRLVQLSAIKGFDFDPGSSIVRFPNASVPRDDGSMEDAILRGDPMAEFFMKSNPGASRGDRLASLTRISIENLTPLGHRFVLGPGGEFE